MEKTEPGSKNKYKVIYPNGRVEYTNEPPGKGDGEGEAKKKPSKALQRRMNKPRANKLDWQDAAALKKRVKGQGSKPKAGKFTVGQEVQYEGKTWLVSDFKSNTTVPEGFTMSLVDPKVTKQMDNVFPEEL